jgi:PAS domain S-box-containing protein
MKPASSLAGRIASAEAQASILLVDDRPANLLALEAILDPLGQRLVRAVSGEEALKHVSEEDFAVILMDVRMPGMDGLRAVELIKQREQSASIPIILLTAVSLESSDVVSGYARGVVDFLLKPFDPEILRSKVSVFLDLYLKEQMIKRQAALLRNRDREAFERRNEQRFRSLMDALPQCVWVAGSDLLFYYSNRRAIEYIGMPVREPVPFSRLLEFVHPEDRTQAQAEWEVATGSERTVEVQVRFKRDSDGEFRWFLIRGVPERDESDRVTRWIVSATDIDTEHEALRRVEAASQMKEEFLAVVSHELRNPLNAIKGWTQLLRSGSLDQAKVSKALETIERNVDLQTVLIKDILDISSIIRGKLHLMLRTLRLAPLVEAAVAAIRPTAEAKRVELKYEIDAQLDIVSGDADRLQQVFWNLLSNAIKFTPRGGSVTVRLTQHDQGLAVMVRDTGQGISPGFLPYVFERFRQAESSITRVQGGLGLGLAIVRHLVEMHGGQVKAESEGVNKGAAFWVFLPLKEETGEDQWRGTGDRGKRGPLDGLSMLVVEDDPDSREALAEAMQSFGAQVGMAGSAQEALALVEKTSPGVLVSDLAMPVVDGFELIRRVRQRIPEGQMPAIALTGLDRPADQERALAAGFQLCLIKPVSLQQLVESVARLIDRT